MDGGKRSKPEDNIAMLGQLRAVDPLAASRFLEHLILEKRSDVRSTSGGCLLRGAYSQKFRIDGYMLSLQTYVWINC